MPILKSSNQEQFPSEVLEPVASVGCHQTAHVLRRRPVSYSLAVPEPGTAPSPGPTHSGFLLVPVSIKIRGQTTVRGRAPQSPTGM